MRKEMFVACVSAYLPELRRVRMGRGGGGGVLPYMGCTGMCGPKGYGFSAILIINGVSILIDFGYFWPYFWP